MMSRELLSDVEAIYYGGTGYFRFQLQVRHYAAEAPASRAKDSSDARGVERVSAAWAMGDLSLSWHSGSQSR